MIKKLLSAAALLLASMVGAQAAPVLSLTPALSNVNVGDVFVLDLRITGALDLYAWQMDLGFSPAGLLNASPATEGDFLGVGGQTFDGGIVDNLAGTITTLFSSLSGASGVSGGGILAHISFQAIDFGSVTLSLSNVLLLDSNFIQIFFTWPDDALNAIVNIAGDGGNNVPEPSTLALVGLALAVSSRARGRQRSAQPTAG